MRKAELKINRKVLAWGVVLLVSFGLTTGCFRPAIPIAMQPNYPVDVFYENQQTDRPFEELQWLEYSEEVPLVGKTVTAQGRMVKRGNNVEQKELMLARLTLQAKKLGADALVAVRYQYFTSATANGYSMRGLAVRYLEEREQ